MIIDRIENADFYRCLSPAFAKAMDFLKNTDLAALPDGRTDIDGEQLFAIVVDELTKPLDQCLWEAHKKYHDVQYIAEGVEQMGYANVAQMKVSVPYDEAKEAAFYEGEGSFVVVPAGTFAIFCPQDVHKPSAAIDTPARVRKIVVKVAV